MRRLVSNIPLILLCGCLFFSCTSKDQFMQERVLDSVFSIDNLDFEPLGESFSFTYSAEGNWHFSKPAWLSITPESGQAGTYEIKVSANMNDEWRERSGAIEVDGHRILVTQPCPYLRISYSESQEETLTVSGVPVMTSEVTLGKISADYAWNHSSRAGRKPFQVKVESNIEWEMVFGEGSEETYFEVDSHNAGIISYTEKEKTVNILATLNNYRKEDLATKLIIRPKVVEGQTEDTMKQAIGNYEFDLNQSHLLFLIDGNADDMSVVFDELGYLLDENGHLIPETLAKYFQVDCEIPWEVQFLDAEGAPFSESFVLSNLSEGLKDELQLEIDGRYNPGEEQREMVVRLSADNGEAVRDIRVVQRPYIFEIDGEGTADTEFDNGELENVHQISLRTSGSWTVEVPSSDPDWLQVDPETSGGGAAPGAPYTSVIRYWASVQNLHLKNPARSVLRFRAINGLVKDIDISQSPFLLLADYDADDLNNISATRTTERKNLFVTASNAWTLTNTDGSPLSETGWYAISSVHGDGPSHEELLSVGAAQKNPSETEGRSFTMLLTSDVHEALTVSEKNRWAYEPVRISIRQRPFTFRINGKIAGETNAMTIPAYKLSFLDFLDIDSDASWTIESVPAWIHPDYSGSDTDRDVLLRPDINLEKTSRTGTVSVKCTWDDNVRTINVKVTQEGLVFDVKRSDGQTMTNLDPDINFDGGNHKPLRFGFDITATDELPWRLESTNSLFVAPVSSCSGSESVSVSPTYHADLNAGRTAIVYITLDNSEDGRISNDYVQRYRANTWTFTQKKYEFDQGDVATPAVFRSLGGLKSGSKTYSFKCSGPWEVSSCPDWIELRSGGARITGGTSDPAFELVPQNNLSLSNRPSSRLTIRSKIGGYTKTITVSQDAYYYGVTSSDNLKFSAVAASSQTIRFRSSGPWKLQAAAEWGFEATSGEGKDDGSEIAVKVTPKDYLQLSPDHTATVTLESSVDGLFLNSNRITLTQDSYKFSVNKTTVAFSSPFQKECAAQAVAVTCTGDWQASVSGDWVRISNGSGSGGGNFSVSVTKDNLTLNEMNATVTVTTTYKGTRVSETTIPISQPAYSFALSKQSHEFDNKGGSVSINITCSGEWAVTKTQDNDSMISSFTQSGSKDGTITITANANTGRGAKDKTATLEVKCEKSNALVKTITLTQKK